MGYYDLVFLHSCNIIVCCNYKLLEFQNNVKGLVDLMYVRIYRSSYILR